MINVKIKEILEEQERSISWLGNKTELSYSSLHKLVNNQTQSISFDTLYKICKVLDCDICDVMKLQD